MKPVHFRACSKCGEKADISAMKPTGVDIQLGGYVRYVCRDAMKCRRRRSDQELEEIRAVEERRFG